MMPTPRSIRSAARPGLDRRMFLKAAGVALALPLLDAMVARGATPAAANPPRRFLGIMTNMGILPQYFFPTTPGRDYESTPYLDLLKEHRNDMTVFSGVSLPGVDGGHATEKSFLTGAPGASRGVFKNSVSLDQVMAEEIGGDNRFPALTLMVGSENLSLSWTRSGCMIPPTTSPLKLYESLFVEDTPASRTAAERRLGEDRSLLDGLRDQAKDLQGSVGTRDRQRLDQYFTSVRDLERRLAKSEAWINRPKPKVATARPAEIKDRNELVTNNQVMFELVRLAFETDSTRVITVALSTGSLTPTQIPGVNTTIHPMTHHGGREAVLAELRRVEEAQFKVFAELLTGLRGAKEGDKTLLDQTAVLYGTNMGSANAHSSDNMPVILAGGGFRHGSHLAFDRKNNYPLSNLYVTLLQHLGIEKGAFSSGTSTMRGLEMA
jgi:hypothetical protein